MGDRERALSGGAGEERRRRRGIEGCWFDRARVRLGFTAGRGWALGRGYRRSKWPAGLGEWMAGLAADSTVGISLSLSEGKKQYREIRERKREKRKVRGRIWA